MIKIKESKRVINTPEAVSQQPSGAKTS